MTKQQQAKEIEIYCKEILNPFIDSLKQKTKEEILREVSSMFLIMFSEKLSNYEGE